VNCNNFEGKTISFSNIVIVSNYLMRSVEQMKTKIRMNNGDEYIVEAYITDFVNATKNQVGVTINGVGITFYKSRFSVTLRMRHTLNHVQL
jgi:hypothetical protein